jgi:hypothetical protein
MDSSPNTASTNDQAKTINLTGPSSCDLVRRNESRLEFRFSERAGFLVPIRWEFRERRELVEYIAQLLSLEVVGDGLRGTAVCFGKYDRRGPNGERAFTFGDPLLDLLTDPAGNLIIGNQHINLAAMEIASPRYRSGGIRSIDLGVISDAARNLQITRAAFGQGDFTLIECTKEIVALASTNPSQLDFYRNNHHLRFKAWKKNYTAYWSMGAEIETWGHDFDSARIESRYLDTVRNQVCSAVKIDSDEDTNDDYVDEYEWGVNAPQPLRVVSNCSANWHGERFEGQVSAGPDCFEV